MNRFYLIVPLLLLSAFAVVDWRHNVQADAQARQQAVEAARAEQAADLAKAEAARKAREDADQRALARANEEKQKAAEKHAKWIAENQRIAADTAGYVQKAAGLREKIASLQSRLAGIAAEKDKLSLAVFDQERRVELARIAKRNAEFEVQRLAEILAERAAGSSLLGD